MRRILWALVVCAATLGAQTLSNGQAHDAAVVSAPVYCLDTGAANALACNLSPVPTAYTTGMHLRIKVGTANTGSTTLAINSLAAKTIKKYIAGVQSNLASGDLLVGQALDLTYDGTNMQLQSPPASVGATAAALTTTPTLCTTGSAPTGILTSGNATGCVAADNYSSSSVFVKEDFISGSSATSASIGQYGWSTGVIGAAATYSHGTESWGHPGVIQIATTSNSGQGGGITLGGTYAPLGELGANAPWSSEWIAYINTTSTVASRIGFANFNITTKIPATAGIYFRYDTVLSDTNWMACVNTSGTETCTSTGVAPVASTYADFYISSTTAATITFSINNSTPVTICASSCTATATPPTTIIEGWADVVTLTTASATLAMDLFMYQASGITR